MKKTTGKGFTLIELLVVIAILAILSMVGLALFSNVQKSVRDAKRKADLNAIVKALEIYHQQYDRYPCTDGWQTSIPQGGYWITDTPSCGSHPLGGRFMSQMPNDAINTSIPAGGNNYPWENNQYSYAYWAGNTETYSGCPGSAGKYYILIARLENESNADRVNAHMFCDGETLIIASNLITGGGADLEKLLIYSGR